MANKIGVPEGPTIPQAVEARHSMPEATHCACKFSSGGVLSKSCEFHQKQRTDALRYRWLRSRAHKITASIYVGVDSPRFAGMTGLSDDDADAAIDEAMREQS